VPAYLVMHDRTVTALAQARPANPRQLLEIAGMGPAKVERFGEAILGCADAELASLPVSCRGVGRSLTTNKQLHRKRKNPQPRLRFFRF